MITLKRKEDCCGCNACGDICPKDAITFKTDKEGFWYPDINLDKCIDCGLCEKVCPIKGSQLETNKNADKPKCYAAEHKNIDVIFSSTTGGAFSAFAEVMYRQKGYVGGAIHNSDFSVSEFISNDKGDLRLLRRSKDLQSNSEGFYKKIKSLLEANEKVMVCALPCQIAALVSYLGRDYENLILIELICLGVNSPKVWHKYLSYIEEINGSKIVYTENKNKEYGWRNLTQKFVFENGQEYFDTRDTSLFIKGYIQSRLYCRPSCYECRFKGFPRRADITIGDYWGLMKHDPSYNKDMGVSIVLVNSDKGEKYFEQVKKRMYVKETPLDWAIKDNPALTQSIEKGKCDRDSFFSDIDNLRFDEAVKKYSLTPRKRVKDYLRIVYKDLKFFKYILNTTRMDPRALYQTFRYSGIKILAKHKGIIFAKNCKVSISHKSHLKIDGLLVIGKKGLIPSSNAESRIYIGEKATFAVLGDMTIDCDCDIEVFDGAELILHGARLGYCNANKNLTIICGEKIEILPDVGIGRNVTIRDTNGNHFMNTLGYKPTKPICIGEKAWLCESCTIMPGVSIGRSAIVGANSMVMSSIPDHVLVSGSPAEVIEKDVLWKC